VKTKMEIVIDSISWKSVRSCNDDL